MRIVVTGATGNVGTSVLASLAATREGHDVLGVARRAPTSPLPGASFLAADVCEADLETIFHGVDAVIHLAWLIQPGRDEALTRRVNIDGSRRVFAAAAAAGVRTLVYASSVGAYSPGPKDHPVDEDWPTDGIDSSFYSRHKAAVERALDQVADAHPGLRIVRLRPGLIFKREAATEIRRLFIGPLIPNRLLNTSLIPVVPAIKGLRFQAVHSDDVGDAYRRAVLGDAVGAFNIAAEPPIGVKEITGLVGARPLPVPARVLRAVAAGTYRLHLQPTEPGWLDMALSVPVMDTTRAREQLGWTAQHDALSTLTELAEGLRDGAEGATPTLGHGASGPGRVREFLTGLGSRN